MSANKAPADSTGSPTRSDNSDVHFDGSHTRTVRNVLDEFNDVYFENSNPPASITNLIIGLSNIRDPQTLPAAQLDMPFVEFVNDHVINAVSTGRRRQMERLLLDDQGRIMFTITANDGQGPNGDYFCTYEMRGLHFNKKIPKNKGQWKKAQKYLLLFTLEPINEAG